MNLDIRFLNKNSEEMWQARELYEKSFDDTEEYMDFFFGNVVADRDTDVIGGFIDEKLVSTMFLRKKKLLSKGQKVRGCFIYGVATAEEYRCKGYMSRLMECALSYCGSVDISFIFLIPVNPKIYEGMGFVMAREERSIPLMDIECDKEEHIVEKIYPDEEISPYSEALSFFAITVEGLNKSITTEKDEHYFMRRLQQAEVENAGVYVVKNKNKAQGEEDMEAIVVTGKDENDDRVCVTDIICREEWDNSLKYAKIVVDNNVGIMPIVRLKPIMIYNWTGMDSHIKLNEDV